MKNHNWLWYAGGAIGLYLLVAYAGGPALVQNGFSGATNLVAAFQGRSAATPTSRVA